MAYLYAPARMEERFRHFEALCLPGLKAQTDPDFLFAILVGEDMPEQWLERLADLVEDFPQAAIIARPPGPHRQVCQSVLNAARRHVNQPCLQVRHDDDDALAGLLHPGLHLEQLDLEQTLGVLVLPPRHALLVRVALAPGVHGTAVGPEKHRVVHLVPRALDGHPSEHELLGGHVLQGRDDVQYTKVRNVVITYDKDLGLQAHLVVDVEDQEPLGDKSGRY